MADETQAADQAPEEEPAKTDAPTAEPTTASADESTTASAEDAQAPAPAPAKTRKPAAAKAKVKAEATTGDASKARKPASPKAPSAEPAKPARAGLRGRAKARGRARRAGDAPVELPVVRAQAKYVRTSARKARLVCDHIRGKSVAEAQAILAFAPRAVAADWAKLLKSAVANAENNHELLGEDLRVKEAFADEGPTLKRFRPRAMGRATPIRKRTSHLTITLTPKE
jgi:ribosomal protein L22